MPRTGVGVFEAIVAKTETFTVDYAARTVSGTISLPIDSGSRVYTLRDVVLSGDGTQFRGRLVTSDPDLDGTIEGQFTGATGEEVFGRTIIPAAQFIGARTFIGARR
jgi:hypothetical protein